MDHDRGLRIGQDCTYPTGIQNTIGASKHLTRPGTRRIVTRPGSTASADPVIKVMARLLLCREPDLNRRHMVLQIQVHQAGAFLRRAFLVGPARHLCSIESLDRFSAATSFQGRALELDHGHSQLSRSSLLISPRVGATRARPEQAGLLPHPRWLTPTFPRSSPRRATRHRSATVSTFERGYAVEA